MSLQLVVVGNAGRSTSWFLGRQRLCQRSKGQSKEHRQTQIAKPVAIDHLQLLQFNMLPEGRDSRSAGAAFAAEKEQQSR